MLAGKICKLDVSLCVSITAPWEDLFDSRRNTDNDIVRRVNSRKR